MIIESLTTEQINAIPNFVEKCFDIGLSTEPVNFEQAKITVCKAYRLAGLQEPTNFHVVDSPISAIKFIQELDPSLSSNDIFSEMCYGSMDISWLSYYKYFSEVVGIDLEKISGLVELCEYTGWFNAYENTVVFQHRPEQINRDDENRLHSENGPAIRYRDGFSVYAWHGTVIPPDWIENKDSLTAEIALTWPNVEQRRCACEIIGWVRILSSLNYKLIDSDPDPMIGDLLEVELPEIGKEKFLQVLCGTGRTFALPVPPEMKTALEAQAWTWEMTPDEFGIGPEVRT